MNPKNLLAALAVALPLLTGLSVRAAENHDGHDHAKAIPGPNGGRVLTVVEPHLEFLLQDDRKIRITAVDDHGKPATLGSIQVSVTGGSRSAPARLTFVQTDGVLVSDQPFPEGVNLPVVVRIQTAADAKPVFERFNLNLAQCPECPYREYACICDHDHHDHDHDH